MRLLRRLITALLTALLVVSNARLHQGSLDATDPAALSASVVPMHLFLEDAVAAGEAARMQTLFPEGFFLTQALLGLSAAELAHSLPPESLERPRAQARAWRALEALDSDAGRAPFSAGLSPPYGAFYLGWTTYLRASAMVVTPTRQREPAQVQQTERDCASLVEAYDRSPTPFLQSYPHQTWPCDSAVAMAAIGLCEVVLGTATDQGVPDFGATRRRWVAAARLHLDPRTGLLGHTADSRSGAPTSPPRGSSVALMARVLHDVDPDLGREHYEGLRRWFLVTRAGVPGIAEHLDHGGIGDVDSGPLLMGVSLSASAVAAGAARLYGDPALADALLDAGEVLGVPIGWGGRRRYLLGALPIADAFGAWARTASPLGEPVAAVPPSPLPRATWRWPFHLLSALLAGLLWLPDLRRAAGGGRW